jgi:putative endonuclease
VLTFGNLIQKKSIGWYGEDRATKFLKKRGYKILERNWCNKTGRRLGEIDIIAKKGEAIVFVEVKTRNITDDNNIVPEEQITPVKLQKLQRVAECYIKEHDLWSCKWQFDAVSVYVQNKKIVNIEHIENIFF